ncbi:MAG: accessory gene regulator B family protein [Epulopiscium sp.]|nr:accessory gene regulator B family protein [Candidatus Epulonipiscium sp.]
MENFIHKLTDGFIENGIICVQDRELYEYGLRQGVIMLCHLITTVMLGLCFGMVVQSILFLVFYIPLRIFAGGFHTRSQLHCYFLTIAMTVAVLLLIRFISWTTPLCFGMSAISAVVIGILAPVEDSNKHLDEKEVEVYRKKAVIILGIEGCMLSAFLFLQWQFAAVPMSVALCMVSGMLIVGKIANIQNAKAEPNNGVL